jgi:hypothetical protein
MWRLSDLINKLAKKEEPYDPRKNLANDYPNGFLFLALLAFAIFFVGFLKPLLGR